MASRSKDQMRKPVLLLVPFAGLLFMSGYSMATPPYSEKAVEVVGAAVVSIFGISVCWLFGTWITRNR